MKKILLLFTLFFLYGIYLYGQEEFPKVKILSQKQDEYSRHPRLQEEDRRKGNTPSFTQGIEVITDIEYVKVYISENEAGRTPYENDEISIGYYRIRLEKTGYEDILIWANVKKDRRTIVTVQYKPAGDGKEDAESEVQVIRKGPVYGAINPNDPAYYTRILYTKELFPDNDLDLLLADWENTPFITLSPEYSLENEYVYHWNGLDIDEETVADGSYSVFAVGDLKQNSSFKVDHRFSRKAASYFSGFTGLGLVPSAQPLFKGSVQFGSFISSDFSLTESGDSANLPFSFLLRFSPVQGWEAAMEAEVSMNQDRNVPQIKLGTSQKVLVLGSESFLMAVNGRFSYRTNINEFSEIVYNKIIRDPSGASLAFPVQLRVKMWDFYIAPEALYSFEPISGNSGTSESDFRGVFRWGLSYSEKYFQAGFSTALYSNSIRESSIIAQSCGEVTIYIPRSPLYVNTHVVYQEIKDGEENLAIGLGIGFLL